MAAFDFSRCEEICLFIEEWCEERVSCDGSWILVHGEVVMRVPCEDGSLIMVRCKDKEEKDEKYFISD
jgi:hypothetical protein